VLCLIVGVRLQVAPRLKKTPSLAPTKKPAEQLLQPSGGVQSIIDCGGAFYAHSLAAYLSLGKYTPCFRILSRPICRQPEWLSE